MAKTPLTDPILTDLYDYWTSRRNDGSIPARRDIEPSDIPRLLPHIMLVELQDPGPRLFMRLVGTKVAFGQDPTGTYMDDSVPPGAYGSHITGLFRRAAGLSCPLYTEFQYDHPDESAPRRAKRLFLPLADDGRNISMLLIGQRVIAPEFTKLSLWDLKPELIKELLVTELP